MDFRPEAESKNTELDQGHSNSKLQDFVGLTWGGNSSAADRSEKQAAAITTAAPFHELGIYGNTAALRTSESRADHSDNATDSGKLDNLKIVDHPSPNFQSRDGQPIQFLVLHYTAEPLESALKRLCDPRPDNSAAAVSAHYVVGVDGTIYGLVDEQQAAWHAGDSYWEGHSKLNLSSVGIEIVNPGNAPFDPKQMEAVTALAQSIIKRDNIPPSNVVGHSDIAVTSRNLKIDPGWYFDWKGLASQGIGVWPNPTQTDYDSSKNWSDSELKQKFVDLGYNPDANLPDLIHAFQQHFQPEVFHTPDRIGKADVETRARLACLLRTKESNS